MGTLRPSALYNHHQSFGEKAKGAAKNGLQDLMGDPSGWPCTRRRDGSGECARSGSVFLLRAEGWGLVCRPFSPTDRCVLYQ